MSEFLNTYHFVPVVEGGENGEQNACLGPTHPLAQVRKALKRHQGRASEEEQIPAGGWGNFSHARWHEGHLSGRITCTLTAEDPLVIGAKQDKPKEDNGTQCTRVEPYKIDDQPAIPATTLKGMLSALVEAASNSAMRVLEDRALSVRQDKRDALSAIGMVVPRNGNGEGAKDAWDLIPLTLPTLTQDAAPQPPNRPFNIPAPFQTLMGWGWKPALKVHVGCRGEQAQEENAETPYEFMTRQGSYTAKNPKFYYMDLHELTIGSDQKTIAYDEDSTKLKPQTGNARTAYLLGQQPRSAQCPCPEENADEAERANWTRGILRVMYHQDRRSEIPGLRKHELFIPVPDNLDKTPRLPIPQEVVDRFHALADERTRTQPRADQRRPTEALPFHPIGTRRSAGAESLPNALRLKKGDLVFFGLKDSPQPEVTVISFSSIWRESKGSVHHYVPQWARPLSPEREFLTPAELMFGVVEVHEGGKADRKDDTVALKGRVRCHPGRCASSDPDPFMEEVRLKILASPKPPSPALYFTPKDREGFIEKPRLNSEEHRARGRKMYLHPSAEPLGEAAIETRAKSWTPRNDGNNNQRVLVRPLKPGTRFTFCIDFDDLPQEALDLLLFACRPSEHFRHRLGLGKSIGLGRVQIQVDKVVAFDRRKRYREEDPFECGREHMVWTPEKPGCKARDATQAAKRVLNGMNQSVRAHLMGIGEPRHIGERQVHPPLENNQHRAFQNRQAAAEEKTFKWCAANYDRTKPWQHQYLRDISGGTAGGEDPTAGIQLPSLLTRGHTPDAAQPRQPLTPPRSPGNGGRGQGAPGKPSGGAKKGKSRPAASGSDRAAGDEEMGKIKFYNSEKGFGLIHLDSGKEIHFSGKLLQGRNWNRPEGPQEGARVAVKFQKPADGDHKKRPTATTLRFIE